MLKITKVIKETAGTTAKDVAIHGLPFIIQNLTASTNVYIKEKSEDGKAASATNGFCIPGGTTLDQPLVATTLSVISDTASTDVRVMILDFG